MYFNAGRRRVLCKSSHVLWFLIQSEQYEIAVSREHCLQYVATDIWDPSRVRLMAQDVANGLSENTSCRCATFNPLVGA